MTKFRFIDLFCGAGGATCGLLQALKNAGVEYEGFVVNHWNVAIQTHVYNHPEVTAKCAAVEDVTPNEIFPTDPKRINLLWASPTCTHFSSALGGAPRSSQLRSQPEYILPYLRLTNVERAYIENVPEFMSWGPLLDAPITYQGKQYAAERPDPRYKGTFFNDWIRSIEVSGYNVDWQILNAADFGAPTSRRRLIVQMVRKNTGQKITWPEPTHAHVDGTSLLFAKPWIPAEQILQLDNPGASLIDREKPLSAKTMDRIKAGIRKFWGEWATAFICALEGGECEVRLDKLPKPFLTRFNGGENRNHSVNEPLPVIDTSNRYGLVSPFLVKYYGTGANVQPVSETLGTITTHDRFGLVQGRALTVGQERYRLDVLFRMLLTSELAAAMSFPTSYHFCGTQTDVKRQIGNAVCPRLAQALLAAVL